MPVKSVRSLELRWPLFLLLICVNFYAPTKNYNGHLSSKLRTDFTGIKPSLCPLWSIKLNLCPKSVSPTPMISIYSSN